MQQEHTEKTENIIKSKLAPVLAEVFGYHALLYSDYAKVLVDERLLIRHQVVVYNDTNNISHSPLNNNHVQSNVRCLFEELPFSSDSIDFAFLPEVIQTSENPHQILREVERVLIPEGILVLVINNPMGLTSMKNQLGILFDSFKRLVSSQIYKKSTKLDCNKHKRLDVKKLPWLQLGKKRISDWFNLLGIEKTHELAVFEENPAVEFRKFPITFCSNYIINKFHKTFADQIIIVGKKKVSTLTPIALKWRKNKQLVRPRIAEPTVQHQAESCIRKIVLPTNIS